MTRCDVGARWGLVILVTATAVLTASAGGRLDGLRWLEGTWKRETARGVVVERWQVLGERTIEGASWSTAPDGSTRKENESLLLCEMGGEVFYISKVAENPYPVPFKLTSLTEGRAIFENPTHDFPTRIGYERGEGGALEAWIEGPGEGGQPRRIPFRFVRQD